MWHYIYCLIPIVIMVAILFFEFKEQQANDVDEPEDYYGPFL